MNTGKIRVIAGNVRGLLYVSTIKSKPDVKSVEGRLIANMTG